MIKQKKKEYQTPMVELMEARVERGFAGSGNTDPQPLGTSGSTESLTGGATYTGNDFD